jgi:ABC-type microcin C transport system duplicated ATPase subunit YejF
VEQGSVETIFTSPRTDYTRALLDAIPRLDREGRGGRPVLAPVVADAAVVVEARGMSVRFPIRDGVFGKVRDLVAVDDVSLSVRQGETLGVVGESGSGKSTLARAVLRLIPAEAGAVTLMSRDITTADRKALRAARRDLQIVFQDPLASLDPRMTIGRSIAEPLSIHRPELSPAAREAEARAMMARVELDPALINRYPHELSGGQNQRVGIARAMILKPKLVICDEAVSALDVQVRAQIIDLLIALQKDMGLAMIFISHDLAVVREISHRVLVLYRGRVVESADRERLYADAQHPYTQALLSAAPIPDPRIERTRERVPRPALSDAQTSLREVSPGHLVADL